MNKELKIRNNYIYELRKNGATLESIGQDFKLTRERVRQICAKLKNQEAKKIRTNNEKI